MRFLLAPISWIYSLIVLIRNWMFDEGLLHSWTVNVPTICVGNLAVGGTGKTPHVEYIVSMLQDKFKVGVLSRGYKRKSSGFLLADDNSTIDDLGDEAMQMHLHFPNIPIAVCEHRVRGINQLLNIHPDLDVVILDDGYQHRRLKAGFYVLLTAHDQLYVNDHLLPYGHLREQPSGALRANAVIVTKCPQGMQPIDRRVIASSLNLPPFQHLHFSTYTYESPVAVFAELEPESKPLFQRPLVITGIAHPEYLINEIDEHNVDYKLLAFADHHRFSKKDMKVIQDSYVQHYADCILTTEKDAVRLRACPFLPDELKDKIYAIPIKVSLALQEDNFQNQIISYVTENNRNR